jgi:serine/threonine-protein kinase
MNPVDPQRWAALSPHLDELLDLDPAARAERLLAWRATDPALADELQAMLARLGELDAAGFLSAPALPPPRSGTGETVGAYTLEREIGQGGMGSVWLARRTDGRYEARVAIKFLQAGLFGGGAPGRFAREGSILARLDHPHIARLLDAGLVDGHRPYLVLEYIDGAPIDVYCREHRLGVAARLRLFLDVLAAVSHAHTRLILHRDLKPSNILVTADGQAKLLDFGVAKLLDDAASAELTQAAGAAYTPLYAAPEQVQQGEVTTATDVYSLGVLLYLLLTGRHPTVAATDAPLDRMRAVVEQEPVRLSEAVIEEDAEGAAGRARELRGDLETIVGRALKKSPSERYATAADLADDLRRYLAHEPILARPDRLGYRSAKFVRRHRLGVAATAAVAVALAAGIGVALREGREAQRQRDQAEGLIEFMLGDLRRKLEPVGRLEVLDVVGTKALAYYAEQAADDLDPASLGRRARALHLLGEIAEKRGQLDEAARSFAQAAAATASLLAQAPQDGKRVFDHAQSEYWIGYIAMRRNQPAEAEQAFRRYLALAEQLTKLDPANLDWRTEVGFAQSTIGVMRVRTGRPADALAPLEAARTVFADLARQRPALWLETTNNLGWLAVAREGLGDVRGAIALEEDKVAALSRVPEAVHNRRVEYLTANARHSIAQRLLASGDARAAEPVIDEALERYRALVRADPQNLEWEGQYAVGRVLAIEVYAAQGRAEAARGQLAAVQAQTARLMAAAPGRATWDVYLRAAQLTWRLRLAPDPSLGAEIDDLLGRVRQGSGQGQTLGPDIERAIARLEIARSDQLAAAGRGAESRALLEQARARLGPGPGSDDPRSATLRGIIFLRMGDVAAARQVAERLQPSSYRHPEHAELLEALAAADRAAPRR